MTSLSERLASLRRRAGASPDPVAASGAGPGCAAPPPDLGAVATGVDDLFGSMARYGALALGAFALWAVAIPLDSAVTAPGVVISDGQNKVLQSRTGGRVAEIFVRDGRKVAAGGGVSAPHPREGQAQPPKPRARPAAAPRAGG